MEIKVYNNVFEKEYNTFEYDTTRPLLEQVEEHINKKSYQETLVECYDSETGQTFYAPMVDDEPDSVMIVVNGKSVDKSYVPSEGELVSVVFLPASPQAGAASAGAIIGAAVGVLLAGIIVVATGGVGAAWVPWMFASLALTGAVAGGFVGYGLYENSQKKTEIIQDDKKGSQLPDVRGAENASLRGNNFPFVLGKHLVTPFIIGDPYTVYTGDQGEDAYIRVLLCVGYAPLKLTDFKLGEFWLAYNQNHKIGDGTTIQQPTYLTGLLKGYSTGGVPDNGDILDFWKNNDIELEILQQTESGNIDYGTIYTEAVDDQQVNANVFYIADEQLDEEAQVTYKGVKFPNKFRTNGCWFTASCPREFTITIGFPSGLYRTYQTTTTSGNTTTTKTEYGTIPMWVCAQWRFYNKNNPSPKDDGSDYALWNNIVFKTPDQQHTYSGTFSSTEATYDKNRHYGNDLNNTTIQALYGDFIGKTLQNFTSVGGEDSISEIRLSATVTLTDAQIAQVVADTNTMNAIEVRILRISPNYINEIDDGTTTTGDTKKGIESYSDLLKVYSVVTKSFDKQEYIKTGNIVPVKPLTDRDYRKYCLVALKAKADSSGYLVNQLSQINCVAESFSPYWDYNQNKIIPEGIVGVKKYYGYFDQNNNPVNRSVDATEREVTKSEYEQARRDGYNWYCEDCGSNYSSVIKNIVFTNQTTHNNRPAYVLTENAAKHNNNSVVSGFMLACVGPQNGPTAVGYEGINLLSIGEWALKSNPLYDGSTFEVDTNYHGVDYQAGDEVPLIMESNGYIYSGIKLEDLLQKLAFCGRAMWCSDDNGRIKVIMDTPVDYAVGVINAQNCISSSNAYNYDDIPAGYYVSFADENDGYNQNQFYVWSDGNSLKNYHGQVESCSIDYVTNPYQMWSLGRYMIALRMQMREILTRKIGPEGKSFSLGDVVLVQSEDLLIGDGSGRIQEVLAEGDTIYGFITDAPYEYKGIQSDDDAYSNQGVTILQPGYAGKSRVVTIPIAMPRSQEVGGVTYTLAVGTTNIVLLGYAVTKGDTDPSATNTNKYNFKNGDICMFGLRNKISAPYRITKIKPDKDGSITETLVPYDESLYNAGEELPSFQNYITPPQVSEPPLTLSDTPRSLVDFQNSKNALNLRMDNMANGTEPVGDPDAPLTVTAKAGEQGIEIVWTPVEANGLRNTVKKYVVELSKNSGVTWATIAEVSDSNYSYQFNRSTDGYPEENVFAGWRVHVKTVNVYGFSSTFTETPVDTTGYGTWIIPALSVSKEVVDRTVVLTTVMSGSQQVYGTIKYQIKIKRTGNTLPVESGSQQTFNQFLGITPDSDFLTPEFNELVQPTTTSDTEPNYTSVKTINDISLIPASPTVGDVIYYTGTTTQDFTNGKYYKYNNNSWSEIEEPDAYEMYSNKMTHTLPLIGQTPRIFIDASKIAVTISDSSLIPANPTNGDVIYYTGTTTTDFTNGRYYQYDGSNWVETPARVFTGVFTFQVPNKTEVPINPAVGDIIHWTAADLSIPDALTVPQTPVEGELIHYIGTTSGDFVQGKYYQYDGEDWNEILNPDFKNNGYYRYSGAEWVTVFSRQYIVDTGYTYEITVSNESDSRTADPVEVTALCTSLSDIVHSHEHYKDLYVEKLSAINANIGLISQGGFGSFDEWLNFWALSDLSAEESGVPGGVKKGAFRVGGQNEYLEVTPLGNGQYKIVLKAGNIELASGGGDSFAQGTYIYDNTYPEQKRLKLTAEGIIAQQNGDNPQTMAWQHPIDVAKVVMDKSGNMIITNASEENLPKFGFQTTGTIYHFDDPIYPTHEEDDNPTNPENISVDGSVVSTDETCLISPSSSTGMISGTVSKEIGNSNFVGTMVFFSKASEIVLGSDHVIKTDGTIEAKTIPAPLSGYNAAMKDTSTIDSNKTVGGYLGLNDTQVDEGIFY